MAHAFPTLLSSGLESVHIDKVAGRQNIAPPDVDQIAYRLEHKEGYADGQQDMSGRERLQTCRLEHRIERINAKVGVFEVTKRGQIDDNAKRKQAFSRTRLDRPVNRYCHCIVP